VPAVLFGSISTIADTSELQRQAFNEAFEAHGLGWHWDRDQYLGLLEESGGAKRIAAYAQARGEQVDAQAIHATKSELFRKSLAATPVPPRSGVVETIEAAGARGVKVGLVTTTSPENVAALVESLSPSIQRGDFAVIIDASQVDQPKPDGAAYLLALETLGERPDACIAIEDNLDGVTAAHAAGLDCLAFPNENTTGHDFTDAQGVVDQLDPGVLAQLGGSSPSAVRPTTEI
jgi:HAD superfamily hydrolase (TIGR01509 family)